MPRAPTPPTPAQAWLLALAAPLRVINDGHPDLLGGAPRGAPSARRILAQVVGDVRTAEPLRAMLEAKIAGRRPDDGRTRSTGTDALRDDDDVAWDVGRVAAWAGYGYVACLLEVDEAWAYLQRAARLARHRYGSWSEHGEAYIAGRRRWKKRAGVRDRDEVTIRAQLLKNPTSPWNVLPWGLDVTAAPPLAWTPRELVVDATSGPWPTIVSALEDAFDGERIVVREGTYREHLVSTRDVELVGEGEAVLAPERYACIHVAAGVLRARGLRFVAGRDADALWVTDGGRLHLDASHVRADDAGVRVDAGGSAWLRDVVVDTCALAVEGDGAHLVATRTALHGNGLTARDRGSAMLGACRIQGADVAIDATGGAVVVVEETSLTGTPTAHLIQAVAATVVLDGCTLRAPHDTAVLAAQGGTAVLVDCRVEGGDTGLMAQGPSRVDARRTRISGAATTQAAAIDGGAVTCASCELEGGCNAAEADAGSLRLDGCNVHGSTGSGIAAARRGSVDVRGGRVAGGADATIEAARGTSLRLEGTELVPAGRGTLLEPRRRGKVTTVDPPGVSPVRATAAKTSVPYQLLAGAGGVSAFLSAADAWIEPLRAELEDLDEANGHGLAMWIDQLAEDRFGPRAAELELDPEASSISFSSADPVLVMDLLDAIADALDRSGDG